MQILTRVAKKSNKAELDTHDELKEIANKRADPIKRKVAKAIAELKSNIDTKQLSAGVRNESLPQTLAAIPFRDLERSLDDLHVDLEAGITDSGEATEDHINELIAAGLLGLLVARRYKFKKDSNVKIDVESRVAQISRSITVQTELAVSDMLYRTSLIGMTGKPRAEQIAQVVGMNQRQANAVINLRKNLQEQNISKLTPRQRELWSKEKKNTDKLVDNYSKRLVSERANMIARTEATFIIARGQTDAWKQAGDEGFVDLNLTTKEWVISSRDRVCSVCAPLSGAIAPFNREFTSGGISVGHPPIHPNCRCTVRMIPPKGN